MKAIFATIVGVGLLTMYPASSVLGQNSKPPKSSDTSRAKLLSAGGVKRIARQLVVKFRHGVTANEIDALNSMLGSRVVKIQSRSGLRRLAVSQDSLVPQILAELRNSPLIEEAGYNYAVQSFAMPNDTDYQPFQWNFYDTASGIWAEDAWDISVNKGQGVVVAVIDTGVAYENFGPYAQAADLNKNFVAPWDFYNNDDHANDDNGHGTHITGTIAQDTNNNFATAGIAYQASIMPLKILSWDGYGSADDLNEAIYYAVDNGAKVINLSLGFSNTGSPDASGQVCTEIVGLNAALQYAEDHNVVVVAAAGNEGAGVVNCPAAYPTVIAVGATRYDGQQAYYSNGGDALDIAAPGGDMLVDQNGDGEPDGILQVSFCNDPGIMFDKYYLEGVSLYGEFCTVMHDGTSMATAHVSATVGLMLGENPSLTPTSVRHYLESTARDYGTPGWDSSYGWGLLHAGAAVAAAIGSVAPLPVAGAVQGVVTDTDTGLPIGGATVTLRLRGDKFTTTSSSNGSYIFSGLQFGDYRVTASASRYHLKHSKLSVTQSSPNTVADFYLEQLGSSGRP
jgi:serine protease